MALDINSVVYSNIDRKPKSILADENIVKGDKLKLFKDFNDVTKVKKIDGDLANAARDWSVIGSSLTNILGYAGVSNNNNNSLTFAMPNGYAVSATVNGTNAQVILTKEDSNGKIHHTLSNSVATPSTAAQMDCCRLNDTQFLVMCYASSQWYYSVGTINTITFSVSLSSFVAFSSFTSVYFSFSYMSNNRICVVGQNSTVYVGNFNGSSFTFVNSNVASSPATKTKMACVGLDENYFIASYFGSSASRFVMYLFYYNGSAIICSDAFDKNSYFTAPSGKISLAKVNSKLALCLFGNVVYSISRVDTKFILSISNFVLGGDCDFLSVLDSDTAIVFRYQNVESRIITLKSSSMNMGVAFSDSTFFNNNGTGGAKLLTKYIISGYDSTTTKLVVRSVNLTQGSSVKNMEASLIESNSGISLTTIDLTFSGIGSRYHICRQVDTNKWILLRQNVSNNYYYLCALTIVDGAIVKGADYLLNTTYFGGVVYKNVNMVKTSTNKVVLATNYSNYIHYCMATVSGMEITISSMTVNAHYLANANYTIEMTETNTDNKAIATYHYSSSYYYAILDTSGSTVSVSGSGSTIDSNGGNGASYPCLIKHIGNNKIITWYINASSQNTCRLYNFNGSNITSVNTSTTSIDTTYRYSGILPFSDSRFLLVSQTNARLYDIVTNTITYRSAVASLNAYAINEEFYYDANNIYVLGQDINNLFIYYNFYYSGNTLLVKQRIIPNGRSTINYSSGLISSINEAHTTKGTFSLVNASYIFGIYSESTTSKKYCNLTNIFSTSNYNSLIERLYSGNNYAYLPNGVKTFKLTSTKTLVAIRMNGIINAKVINDNGSSGELSVSLGAHYSTTNTAPDQFDLCVIDSSTFVFARHNGGTVYCRVCTIDGNDNITVNTEYSVASNTQVNNVGLAKLSSTRFVVCLDSGNESYKVRCYVGTISETVISFGSAQDHPQISYSGTYNNFKVVGVDTDKFVMFTSVSTVVAILGVCTVSGNTITFNNNTPTTVCNGVKFKAILIDTNKIVVFGFYSNTIYGRIITISDTSYSQGNIFTQSAYNIQDDYSGVDIEKLSSTSFIFSAVGIANSYISNWTANQRPHIAFVGKINISETTLSYETGVYITNSNIISSYYGSNVCGFIITADSKIYAHIEGYNSSYGCLIQFKFLNDSYLYSLSNSDSGFKTFSGTSSAVGAIQVDHNFVIPFNNGSNTKIVAYDINNGFTYGSEATLIASNANLINVARMNSAKACVIVAVGGTLYVCSVSAVGFSVSVGSNTTSISVHSTCYFADVLKHNEDTVVVFYATTTNGYPAVRAFTIGTSSVTAHTETAVENTAIRVGALNQPITAYPLDANRGIVAYLMSGSNTIKVAFYTINYASSKSVSYSFLTDLNYTSFIGSQYFDLFKIYSYDTNKFLIAYIQNGALMLRTIRFTGSTFSELKTNIVGIRNDTTYKPVMLEFKKGIYYLMTADGNNNYQKLIEVNLSTDEIFVSDDVKFPNIGFGYNTFGVSNYDDDTFKDKILLGYLDNDYKFMHFKIINVPEYYNFNGIAEETANAGQLVRVALAGQFTEALTGLMPGRVVYMDKFSLKNVYTKNNSVMLGLAHSENKLLLANTDEQIEFLNNKIK